MKKWIVLCLMLLSVLVACEETQDTVKDGVNTGVGQIDKAKVLSDLTLVTSSLQEYHLQNQKNPESIDELKLKLYHPEDLVYDAKTGTVRSKSYPNL